VRSDRTNRLKSIVDDIDFASSRRALARRGAGLALTLACTLGLLTPPSAAAPMREGRGGDDMRETITLLMMVRMKNELGLSQQQYEQVLPKVEERERSRQTNFRSRRERLAKLREVLAREGAKDSEFTEAVESILALDEADRRQDESFVADMRRILSPRQQAQLLIFRQRFRQWIEGRMRDAQELRHRYGRPGAGRGGTGAPYDDGGDGSGSQAPDRP
jgi:Spy/CpxP family protein refolding chaperone